MAKKAKKRAVKGKIFVGDLPKVRNAINAVAKRVEAGRKKAAAKVAEGKKAAKGTPASDNLAANKAALKRAEVILDGLRKAKTMMGNICCMQNQGCNFMVRG